MNLEEMYMNLHSENPADRLDNVIKEEFDRLYKERIHNLKVEDVLEMTEIAKAMKYHIENGQKLIGEENSKNITEFSKEVLKAIEKSSEKNKLKTTSKLKNTINRMI